MARTTVEDCLRVCPNHFELTMIAAQRARKMAVSGDAARVDEGKDKSVVIALREIRSGLHLEPDPVPVADEETDEEAEADAADGADTPEQGASEAD